MHACERAVGAVARDLVATPEPELAPVRGNDLVGNEPHQRERASGGVEAGLGERGEILLGAHVTFDRHAHRVWAWVSQPSSCQRTRSASVAGDSAPSWRQQRANRSPCSVSASTTTRVHASPRSSSRASNRSARPLAANAATSTRRGGRVQLHLFDQIGRRGHQHGRPGVEAARELVERTALHPEPGEQRVGGERGDVTERPQPEPDQQVGEIGVLEDGNRPRREELG